MFGLDGHLLWRLLPPIGLLTLDFFFLVLIHINKFLIRLIHGKVKLLLFAHGNRCIGGIFLPLIKRLLLVHGTSSSTSLLYDVRADFRKIVLEQDLVDLLHKLILVQVAVASL